MLSRSTTFLFCLLAIFVLSLYVLMSNPTVNAQGDGEHQTFIPVVMYDLSILHKLVGVFDAIDGRIYSVRGDGSDVMQLTPDASFRPAWSPNSEWITYIRPLTETGSCNYCYAAMMMKPDGSEKRSILPIVGGTSAYWAPQGDYIFVIHDHCRDEDTRECQNLYFTTSSDNTASPFISNVAVARHKWSPDGQKLAYLLAVATAYGTRLDLYIVDINTQQPRKIYEDIVSGDEFSEPIVWSNDSQTIAFTVQSALENDIDIFTVNTTDLVVHRVTSNYIQENLVGWVDNGNRLLIRRGYDTYLLTLDGEVTLFIEDTHDPYPDPYYHIVVHGILSDGKSVLYQSAFSINVKSIETNEITTFTPPRYERGTRLIMPVALSPSGNYFAYTLAVTPNMPSTPDYYLVQTIDLLSDPKTPTFATAFSPTHFQWTSDSRYLIARQNFPSLHATTVQNIGVFAIMNPRTGNVDGVAPEGIDIRGVTDSWYYNP